MEGKEIGETLRRLLELVLEDPSLNRRELLLEKLRAEREGLRFRTGGIPEKISSVSETMGWPKCPHILGRPFHILEVVQKGYGGDQDE